MRTLVIVVSNEFVNTINKHYCNPITSSIITFWIHKIVKTKKKNNKATTAFVFSLFFRVLGWTLPHSISRIIPTENWAVGVMKRFAKLRKAKLQEAYRVSLWSGRDSGFCVFQSGLTVENESYHFFQEKFCFSFHAWH